MKNHQIITLADRIKDGKELRMKINMTLSEVEKCVDFLKLEIKKSNVDFSFLKQTCFDLIACLPIPIHLYGDTFIIRSRPNFNGEVFNKFSEISYNPFPDKIQLNRFNLKEEPVFYCAAPIDSGNANGALTTICESFKDLFDSNFSYDYQYLTLSKWDIIKRIPLIMLTFYDKAWQKSFHIQNINPLYVEFMNSVCSEEDIKKCEIFYNYFSEATGKKFDTSNNYLLTTAFYHALKEYYGAEIGILYSSSMTDNNGLNIVLSKEIIDNNYLELDTIIMYKCVRDNFNPKKFAIYPCSRPAQPDKDGKFSLSGIL